MRPVNLIPLEERRGQRAPLRTGPLPYLIVAVLAVALVGLILVVTASNTISDRKAEKATLETEVAQAEAAAEQVQPYTEFASLETARHQTVTSLATSRFDWERVLSQLALVIPDDVWLTGLQASATGGASSSSSSSSASVQGPSLNIDGCAAGHDAVAGFLAALREIDGLTRVSVLTADTQSDSSGSSGSSSSTSPDGGASCSSRNFVVTFSIVAAFDDAQIGAPDATASPSAVAAPASTAAASDGSTSTTAATGSTP